MGENVSFVFEPVSAFAHIFTVNVYELTEAQMIRGLKHYLVIDVGGGTTDLAFIEASTKEIDGV